MPDSSGFQREQVEPWWRRFWRTAVAPLVAELWSMRHPRSYARHWIASVRAIWAEIEDSWIR